MTAELYPFLAQRWRDEMELIGPARGTAVRPGGALSAADAGQRHARRCLAGQWRSAGSDLGMMQQQLLDAYGISTGILMPMTASTFNLGLGLR